MHTMRGHQAHACVFSLGKTCRHWPISQRAHRVKRAGRRARASLLSNRLKIAPLCSVCVSCSTPTQAAVSSVADAVGRVLLARSASVHLSGRNRFLNKHGSQVKAQRARLGSGALLSNSVLCYGDSSDRAGSQCHGRCGTSVHRLQVQEHLLNAVQKQYWCAAQATTLTSMVLSMRFCAGDISRPLCDSVRSLTRWHLPEFSRALLLNHARSVRTLSTHVVDGVTRTWHQLWQHGPCCAQTVAG